MLAAEPVLYIIRSGSRYLEYGDPYEFSATMIVHDKVATIVGATGILPSRKAIAEMLKSLDIESVRWERITNGVTKRINAATTD